jgi:hypothetical protein
LSCAGTTAEISNRMAAMSAFVIVLILVMGFAQLFVPESIAPLKALTQTLKECPKRVSTCLAGISLHFGVS